MRKILTSLAIAGALLLPLSASAQDVALPAFEPADECFVDITTDLPVDCGYITVPAFYDGRSDDTVRLAIFRIHSTGEAIEAAPMFVLDGGPGGSSKGSIARHQQATVDEAAARAADPAAATPVLDILAQRDLVFLAQRGTEFTDPHLDCPEVNASALKAIERGLGPEGSPAFEAEILQGCVDRYVADGVDLDAFNSFENADDVDLVRKVLGYDRIIYYGESYGAQLGEFVMQRHPDILEAVILDGVNPLSKARWADDRGRAHEDTLGRILAMCAADAKCTTDFPEPEDLLGAALAKLEDRPLPGTITSSDGTVSYDVEITPRVLGATLMNLNPYTMGAWPLALSTLSQGDTRLIASMYAGPLFDFADPTKATLSDIQHFAMVCSDDPPDAVGTPGAQPATALGEVIDAQVQEWYRTACPILDTAVLPASSDEDVALDVPTLILSGALWDDSTPPFRNQQVADGLPDARLVSFPYGGHVQYRPDPCVQSIVSRFVNDPASLDTLETSCVAEMSNPITVFLTARDVGLDQPTE